MKNIFLHYIISMMLAGILALQPSSVSYAQVVMDGTMGTSGQIRGPNYDIKAKYGQHAGANLFHSFRQFDIRTDEVANFGVSSDIQNIISRVTGGESWIDGTLRSTISGTSEISGANLYLLNPAGLIFGPNAALDLGGSFHATTADYLRMGEHERFYAIPGNDVLSVEHPSAFGFLDTPIGKIEFKGGGGIVPIIPDDEITEPSEPSEPTDTDVSDDETIEPTGLIVSDGETISVIAGDIEMSGTYYDDDPLGNLNAPGGRINMASVASPGEVAPTDSGMNISSESLGDITISDYSLIDVGGEGSGDIFIRAGRFFADRGVVKADTYGNRESGITDIQVNEMSLKASNIFSDTTGKARGGSISLGIAESLVMSEKSRIYADTTGVDPDSGDAGDVLIETKSLSMSDASMISSDTYYGGGKGGVVRITGSEGGFAESIRVSTDSGISSGAVDGIYPDAGHGGNVELKAKNILFEDAGFIATESKGDGKGGNIHIEASESLIFQGSVPGADEDIPSLAYTAAYATGEYAGDAGDIFIESGKVLFGDGGGVTAQTEGPGDAGNITMNIGSLRLDTGATISSASTSETMGGDAGKITIRADGSITLSGESEITTHAQDAGKGQISIDMGGWLYLTDSKITTSIKKGGEDAGNIHTNQDVLILNRSEIVANAYKGRGGNIHIFANPLVRSFCSRVDASSALGIDGSVYIYGENEESISDLTIMPSAFFDAARWMKTPCSARSGENISHFVIIGMDGLPASHGDLLESPLFVPEE